MNKLVFATGILALTGCARPVAPEGGPKDSAPPQVVSAKSTPNNSTRFAERTFELTFDEWVTLQEVTTQVLVSPPLVKRPQVTLKGRTVSFKFDKEEILRPNTTYTVNFGSAVKDLHEGIPAKDLRFVFSTGDFIDSLSVSGMVADAFTGDPVENISVLLYDNLSDSVVLKERPYYLAQTDKSGQFQIQNVRAGVFKIVAIDDADQNLRWGSETERIGFPDSLLIVKDSIRSTINIRISKPTRSMRLATQNAAQYGLIKLGFLGAPDSVKIQSDQPNLRWLREQTQDTLLVWYDLPDSTAWKLLVNQDTVPVKALSRPGFLQQNRLFFGDEQAPGAGKGKGRLAAPEGSPLARAVPPPRSVNIRPGAPVRIPFNFPVSAVDTSRCLVVVDSAETRLFSLTSDSAGPRVLRLDLSWQSEKRYSLTLLPGALTDFWGQPNADTLRRNFIVPAEKQLGSLNLTLDSLLPGIPYVLRLMNGNNVEEERFFSPENPTTRFVFTGLSPVAYVVQVIEDINGNRRWDPSDYISRRQPERVFLKKLEQLRANWEVEVVMQVAERVKLK